MNGYVCEHCGKSHDGLALSFACSSPVYWRELEAGDRERRGWLNEDLCVLDEHRFVRGNIEIPIRDDGTTFVWSIWVTLSEQNFDRARGLWTNPDRVNEQPYFGWLSNVLPAYPQTLNLKTRVHTQSVGIRPLIELEPTDHPLARDQRDGISMKRAHEIAILIQSASNAAPK